MKHVLQVEAFFTGQTYLKGKVKEGEGCVCYRSKLYSDLILFTEVDSQFPLFPSKGNCKEKIDVGHS